jgi:hypothetical protein
MNEDQMRRVVSNENSDKTIEIFPEPESTVLIGNHSSTILDNTDLAVSVHYQFKFLHGVRTFDTLKISQKSRASRLYSYIEEFGGIGTDPYIRTV